MISVECARDHENANKRGGGDYLTKGEQSQTEYRKEYMLYL